MFFRGLKMTKIKELLNRKVNFKNLIVILLFMPIICILIIFLMSFICGLVSSILPMHYKDKMILKGYYEKEEHFQKMDFRIILIIVNIFIKNQMMINLKIILNIK